MSKHKDRAHIVATMKLLAARKPYYYQIILWDSIESLKSYFDIPAEDHSLAMTTFESWFVDEDTGSVYINPKLGEIHFARAHWNINVITHETMHAVIHRMRLVWPPADLINSDAYPDAEEEIAYEAGNWVEKIHEFLWLHDPGNDPINSKPWQRIDFEIPRFTAKIKHARGRKQQIKRKRHVN